MTGDAVSSVPLACVPDAIPAGERSDHFARAKSLLQQFATGRTELPNGYAFSFDATALTEVARFIDNERKCCPFITFELKVTPGAGLLHLRMTGRDGTRAVLEAELSLSRSCGCVS
jgi:hypothetical protein